MQLIMILGYIASGLSAVVLGCLWVPSIERMIGFLVVQVGLIIANAGLKLSVCGGRMVDDARPRTVKPTPFDGIPVGSKVPCDCPLCRDDAPSIVLLRSRPQSWTRPLSTDQLN